VEVDKIRRTTQLKRMSEAVNSFEKLIRWMLEWMRGLRPDLSVQCGFVAVAVFRKGILIQKVGAALHRTPYREDVDVVVQR
jgi:hypothetical protein